MPTLTHHLRDRTKESSATEPAKGSEPSRSAAAVSAALSVMTQLAALIIYPGSFADAGESSAEYLVVLAGSMLLTPLSLYCHSSGRPLCREGAFWLRAILVIVLSIPLSGDRWPAFLLILSLIIDASTVHTMLWSVLISAVLIVLDTAAQMERRIWGMEVAASSWDVLTAHIAAYVLVLYTMILLMHWHQRLVTERTENNRLKETVERLTCAGEDFLSYAQSARQRSAEDERNRLTREIHDVAGYTLTNIRMMMEAGLRNPDMSKEELEKLLTWTLNQSQEGQQEIRSILRLIRSRGEPHARGIQSLLQAARVFQIATDTEVRIEWGNVTDRWTAGGRDLLALRILQEGMINAFRHGMAKRIDVSFFEDAEGVSMVVHDDGKGADSIEMGIGLSGMKERLQATGGDLVIDTDLPGFRISAYIPTVPEGHAPAEEE